jgi:hypothetical protein
MPQITIKLLVKCLADVDGTIFLTNQLPDTIEMDANKKTNFKISLLELDKTKDWPLNERVKI